MLAYAGAVLLTGSVLLYVGPDSLSETWFRQVGFALWMIGFVGVPLAIGIAIFKYRLYDIDTVINRTLVYGSLTVMLGLLYFGGVTATQALFRTLTGLEESPQLVVVASTLAIAALFNPLRRRIQSFIDRRFYRRKYDARKTLQAFSPRLRDETDLEALSNDLVRETMQPAHVSLWLRPETDQKASRQSNSLTYPMSK